MIKAATVGGRSEFRLAAFVVTLAVVVGACGTATTSPTPKAPQTTIWRAITDQVNGPISKDVALEAFAYLYGATIPGVHVPDGSTGTDGPQSGTGALSWVRAHWTELTLEQRRAIALYATPQPGDLVLQNPTAIGGPTLALRGPVDLGAFRPALTPLAAPNTASGPSVSIQRVYAGEIQADLNYLGPRLGLPVLTLNSLQFLEKGFATILLGTTPCPFSSPEEDSPVCPPWARFGTCNMIVPKNTWDSSPTITPLLHTLFMHESVHCYQNSVWSSQAAADNIPAWIREGTALWLSSDATKTQESMIASQWNRWFNEPGRDLANRTYDGFAYLALLDHLGRNLWTGMVPAWRAANDALSNPTGAFVAAFNGDAEDVQQDWGPSLLNTAPWGSPWVTNGFGLPLGAAVTQGPAIGATKYGTGTSSIGRAAFVETVVASEGEIVFVDARNAIAGAHETSGAGRSHLGFSSLRFCVQGDCICKPGTKLAGQRMADEDIALPFVVAFHGTVGSWQSQVASLSMDDLCGQDPTPRPSGGSGPPLTPCPKGCAGSNGDPHLVTVNAHRYDFQAAGEFTLLRSPDGMLEVQGRQEPWHDTNKVSINTAVAARVGGHKVGIYVTPDGLQARVDGTIVDATAPIDLGSGGRILAYPKGYEIDFPDGTKLWTLSIRKWGINALIRPSSTLVATGVGLLGPVLPGGLEVPALPDGTRLPRATDPHAGYVELYTTLANAWRVTDASSLFTYDAGASTASFTKAGFPDEVALAAVAAQSPDQSALAACAAIQDSTLRDQCLFDVMVTGEAGFADLYAVTQTFQQQGVAGLGPTAAPGSAAPETPAPTLGPLPPAGITQLIPLIDGVSGGALAPDGTLYLSILLPDNHSVVAAVDPRRGLIRTQVDAIGAGLVAFASGSAWVGEATPDGVCSIVRLDAASLATQASVAVPCTFIQPLFRALGPAIWFVDQTAVDDAGKGAVLRMIDPATNEVSTTAVPLPFGGGFLSSSPGSTALVYGDVAKTLAFMAQGATAFTPLTPLGSVQWLSFPVSKGAWTYAPGGTTTTLVGPTGVLATVPFDGFPVGADDQAVYVDGVAAADGSGTLWRYPADGSAPAQIAQGAAVGTANGNDTLGYGIDSPTLVGQHELVTVWVPVSRTDPLHHALDIQWVALP